jgi:hypothetical protein
MTYQGELSDDKRAYRREQRNEYPPDFADEPIPAVTKFPEEFGVVFYCLLGNPSHEHFLIFDHGGYHFSGECCLVSARFGPYRAFAQHAGSRGDPKSEQRRRCALVHACIYSGFEIIKSLKQDKLLGPVAFQVCRGKWELRSSILSSAPAGDKP